MENAIAVASKGKEDSSSSDFQLIEKPLMKRKRKRTLCSQFRLLESTKIFFFENRLLHSELQLG
jgi:hypothetical protein